MDETRRHELCYPDPPPPDVIDWPRPDCPPIEVDVKHKAPRFAPVDSMKEPKPLECCQPPIRKAHIRRLAKVDSYYLILLITVFTELCAKDMNRSEWKLRSFRSSTRRHSTLTDLLSRRKRALRFPVREDSSVTCQFQKPLLVT